MKHLQSFLLGTLALTATSLAYAQSAGTVMARVNASQQSTSGASDALSAPSLPGSSLQAENATGLTAGVTYMVTDNVSLDAQLGLGLKTNLVGAGALAGSGKLGDFTAQPFHLITQYRFMTAKDAFRPFVGIGLTYAYFTDTSGTAALSAITGGSPTTFKVQSKLAPSVQLGAAYAINDRWYVEGSLTKTMLKTTVSLSTGNTAAYKMNPLTTSIGLGYRF